MELGFDYCVANTTLKRPRCKRGRGGDALEERELKFGKIVRGELLYDSTNTEYALQDSTYTYRMLKEREELRSLGTADDYIYEAYYQAVKETNIGQFEKINDYLKDTTTIDTTAAHIENQNILSRNSPEENKKMVNEVYIKQMAYECDTTKLGEGAYRFYTYTEEEVTLLNGVAFQNPIYGGEAVIQSRTMLQLDITDDLDFENRNMQLMDNGYNFSIYPNPNNGTMTVKYTLNEGESATIALIDITGRLLKTQLLKSDAQQSELNANELAAGTYFYKISVNGTSRQTGKIVIIK